MNEDLIDYECFKSGHNWVKEYDNCLNCGYSKVKAENDIFEETEADYNWDMSYDDSERGY